MFYTGIGSRKTPEDILRKMTDIANILAKSGYTLRSGGADGADHYFELGANEALGKKEIYLPWKGFNKNSSTLLPKPDHFKMAATLHPVWDRLTDPVKALHARNTCQVLGDDLATPSRFVICWTPDGAETASEVTKSTGGTGTAIRLANQVGIRVFNLAKESSIAELNEELDKITTEAI